MANSRSLKPEASEKSKAGKRGHNEDEGNSSFGFANKRSLACTAIKIRAHLITTLLYLYLYFLLYHMITTKNIYANKICVQVLQKLRDK